jgi:hypothetical protein
MTLLHASAERTVSAPAAAVYDRLADYRVGHPSILPPSFSDLKVLQGGTGAGTAIRFAMTLGGRKQLVTASVDEPEPGRVLTETYPDRGAVTSFTVDSVGTQSRVRIETSWEAPRGLAGLIERLITPRLFRKIYAEELDLIEGWAVDRNRAEHAKTR